MIQGGFLCPYCKSTTLTQVRVLSGLVVRVVLPHVHSDGVTQCSAGGQPIYTLDGPAALQLLREYDALEVEDFLASLGTP